MKSNEIRTRTTVLCFDPVDGIIRATVLPGIEETLADAQENIRAGQVLGAGRRPPVLLDIRGMKSQDRQARRWYASAEAASATQAVALLVESRISMMIANFFIGITRTDIPTRIFTNQAEALAWLKGFLDSE